VCVLSVLRRSAPLAAIALLVAAAPASAAGSHVPLVAGDFLGIGHLTGSVFGGIGHAVLGAFTWTFGLASKFILVTLGALVKLLIPASWAKEGVQIMRWIVAIPDYAGTVSTPGGHHAYGFAGINELRDLFTWLGAAMLPLTLVYATSRAAVGHGNHVAIPILRVVALGALLISYPYWWAQAAAVINQMTDMVLSLAPVTAGIHKLMLYAVQGVALGGWQLIDLTLMGAIGITLLSLIFLKVVIILLGALLYATGPIMIGLVPTDAGAAISRAWLSAVGMLLLLPVAWAAVFAVGALLINDAGTAGPLVAGNSDVGKLLGGVLLAVAGLASLWVCLRIAREAASLLRIQLGGMLSLAGSRSTSAPSVAAGGRSQSAVSSIRGFQSRVNEARSAAVGALAAHSPVSARVARAGGIVGGIGRRGVLGSSAAAVRAGAASAAPRAAHVIGRSRAGAVAVQMAKAGTAGWQNTAAPAKTSQRGTQAFANTRATGPSAPRDTGRERTPASGHSTPRDREAPPDAPPANRRPPNRGSAAATTPRPASAPGSVESRPSAPGAAPESRPPVPGSRLVNPPDPSPRAGSASRPPIRPARSSSPPVQQARSPRPPAPAPDRPSSKPPTAPPPRTRPRKKS
jgi:hypothetical protein